MTCNAAETTSDDGDLDFEIKMMTSEEAMSAKPMPLSWQRRLAWLRELQYRRRAERESCNQMDCPYCHPSHELTPAADPHETICTWPFDGRAPRREVRPCNRTDCPYCHPNHEPTPTADPHETDESAATGARDHLTC